MDEQLENEERYSRNIGLFGRAGQDALARTPVSIVGLGGLGSHVAQQLAYLGVKEFVLIDPDMVSESSLNRLIGATPQDVTRSTPKVSVAERGITATSPDALVSVRISSFLEVSQDMLHSAVILGCIDNDLSRLQLMEMCMEAGRPYFDTATDTGGEEGDPWYGGRLVVCLGRGCLVCLEVLNQEAIRHQRATPEELDIHERIYGVRVDSLNRSGPAVVSINGVVASLAVTEFMVEVTGLRDAAIELTYRAHAGVVFKRRDPGPSNCFYCSRLREART